MIISETHAILSFWYLIKTKSKQLQKKIIITIGTSIFFNFQTQTPVHQKKNGGCSKQYKWHAGRILETLYF